MRSSTFAAVAALMASAANAHMIMKTPTPFNSPNNSPLDPSGSDFPCKGPPTTKTANTFQAGQNQTLSFTGTAVHGGGSCQLSVTTDTNPTKNSKFKVIHSIEGGCPGVNGGGSDFSFAVPTSVPNGDATFAWTWFNKIGNREMYMNCASITVSGGASDTSEFDKLPDMAIANIAAGTGASCKTSESSDYTFANPGTSVQVVGSGPFKELCGGAASVGAGSGASGGSSASPGAASSAAPNNGQYTPPAAATSAAATKVPAAKPTSNAGGVFAPGASSADPVTSTISTLVTVTSPTAAPAAPTGAGNATAPAPSAAQPTQPASTATPVGNGSSCSTDGAVVCNGESQFGICDHGKVVWMAVAAGTKCSDGKIAKREFVHRVRARRSIY